MGTSTHPTELIGTWNAVEGYRKGGAMYWSSDPATEDRLTAANRDKKSDEPWQPMAHLAFCYTLAADGSGSSVLQDEDDDDFGDGGRTYTQSLHWSVVEGTLKLRLADSTSANSYPYELPDSDTLVLRDPSGGWTVLRRG